MISQSNLDKLITSIIIFLLITSCSPQRAAPQADNYRTIYKLQSAIQNHQITCLEATQLFLKKIYQYNLSIDNRKAPLNAISQINPDVLNQANALDKQYTASNKIPGRLFCIPVIVKDNIDVLGMETASGSYALIGTRPLHDSLLVSRLKKEGAIIIAKGAMDELAMGASGFSSLDGMVGNAYDTSKNPGGSSGGVAAAIAANFALIGIGTDNSGSVRIPAAFNGLYGLRPTMGLIDKDGVFPMGNIDGTPGPIAQNVRDLAISLNVLSIKPIDYTNFLNHKMIVGKTVAVLGTAGNYDVWDGMPVDIKNIYAQAIDNLAKSGIKIRQLNLPNFDNNRKYHMAGTPDDVNTYLSHNIGSRNNMEEICTSDMSRVMGSISQCVKLVNGIADKNSQEYKQALAIIDKNIQYVTKIMHKEDIDAILLPVSKSGSSTYDLKQVNTWQAPISSNTGLPSIVIQIGHDKDKMPIAMEIVGDKYSEGQLLSIAYDYERHYMAYTPPQLVMSHKFDDWSISQLNTLFRQIGKNTYEMFIKPQNKNEVSAKQSYTATVQAIRDLN